MRDTKQWLALQGRALFFSHNVTCTNLTTCVCVIFFGNVYNEPPPQGQVISHSVIASGTVRIFLRKKSITSCIWLVRHSAIRPGLDDE